MSEENKQKTASDLQTIQESIGYGHGTTIGYTDNDTVFILTDTKDADGRPMQTLLEMNPERTRFTIEKLEAALKAIESGAARVQ